MKYLGTIKIATNLKNSIWYSPYILTNWHDFTFGIFKKAYNLYSKWELGCTNKWPSVVRKIVVGVYFHILWLSTLLWRWLWHSLEEVVGQLFLMSSYAKPGSQWMVEYIEMIILFGLAHPVPLIFEIIMHSSLCCSEMVSIYITDLFGLGIRVLDVIIYWKWYS